MLLPWPNEAHWAQTSGKGGQTFRFVCKVCGIFGGHSLPSLAVHMYVAQPGLVGIGIWPGLSLDQVN